ncbi:unnamed protein product [Polarella glacialis]|uniref:BTB domain-containing protein n=2 Tax=Polarella glacialis TaxID=89957 RepID=A0A813JRF5_POLGL|nr:unnamed protein product [Polarella glacialis]
MEALSIPPERLCTEVLELREFVTSGRGFQRFAINDQESLANRLRSVVDLQPDPDAPESGFADVIFEVGGQRLGGLRSILGLRCSVLQGMLCGDFREASSGLTPVRLPEFDASPDMFREFLYFLHSGIASFSEASEAMRLYEIARFFCVEALASKCSEFLQKAKLQPADALMLVKFALRHEMWDLLTAAWMLIGRSADAALVDSKGAIVSLPPCLLRFLFESDHSSVSEGTLLRILLELGDQTEGSSVPEKEIQSQRDELLSCVRLPLIPAREMMSTVVPCKLFDLEKCVAALAFQSDPGSVDLPAEATNPRRFLWHSKAKKAACWKPRRKCALRKRKTTRQQTLTPSPPPGGEAWDETSPGKDLPLSGSTGTGAVSAGDWENDSGSDASGSEADGWCMALVSFFPIAEVEVWKLVERDELIALQEALKTAQEGIEEATTRQSVPSERRVSDRYLFDPITDLMEERV